MTTASTTASAPVPAGGVGAGISARGVSRRFGTVMALRGLDLVAPYGEVTGLVGPNGAGKTTLLLILASLLTPDSGEVRVGGHDPVTETDAVRAVMGWVPDVFGVYDNLTPLEYLRFAGEAYRLDRAAASARAAELLRMARLDEHAGSPVHVLSRGQKQRLGLVRALIHRPRVLLADEPAAGLDPHSRVQLRELMRALAADGVAVLLSSHVLSDVEEVADRVVFVDRGATVDERRIEDLGAVTAQRTWRLRALNSDALAAALDRHGYQRSALSATGIDVTLDSDAAAAALIAGLVHDGVQLVACAPVTGTLEAAYLNLTEEHE